MSEKPWDMSEVFTRSWEQQGISCGITYTEFGTINGYIQLPEGWEGDIYDLECNGGITYPPDAGRWTGFDTNHSWDVWPRAERLARMKPEVRKIYEDHPELTLSGSMICESPIHWTEQRVMKEVNQLAEQVADGA